VILSQAIELLPLELEWRWAIIPVIGLFALLRLRKVMRNTWQFYFLWSVSLAALIQIFAIVVYLPKLLTILVSIGGEVPFLEYADYVPCAIILVMAIRLWRMRRLRIKSFHNSVSMADAVATALRRFPGLRITTVSIGKVLGRPCYVVSGVTNEAMPLKLHVYADTGRILS
jgi:hypothetical protein